MRYAFISDVHGNLPALDAVLADIKSRAADQIFHLGDLVGYGPWPNEVVDRIRTEGISGVAGNYDSTVASRHEHCGCQYDDPRQQELSMDSYSWTLDHVSETTAAYLRGLPFRIDLRPAGGHAPGRNVILVHGSPTLNTVYWREERPLSFEKKMIQRLAAEPGDVVLFGHTHKPWTREVDGCLLINTGSVGRPKDRDPRGCYVMLDFGEPDTKPEFVRVPYDVERTAAATTAAGLPGEFATILRTGGYLE